MKLLYLLLLIPCIVFATTLPVTINGTIYTIEVNNDDLFNAFRNYDPVHIPKDSTGPVSARANNGTVFTVSPDGSIYQDGLPFGVVNGQSPKTQLITLWGNTVYSKGLVSGKWFRWTGTNWVDASNAYQPLLDK